MVEVCRMRLFAASNGELRLFAASDGELILFRTHTFYI